MAAQEEGDTSVIPLSPPQATSTIPIECETFLENQDELAISTSSDDVYNDHSFDSPDSSISETSLETTHTSYPLGEQELQEWITEHRDALKQSMIEAIGEANTEFMFEEINKANPLLNDPVAQYPLEDDLTNRYALEQSIRDLILLHKSDPTGEILDVKCIQGLCEVTYSGIEQNDFSSWYILLVGNRLDSVSEARSPTIFMTPDGGYWAYILLKY
ncbi:hypothetical protein D210916BOD24_34090 [Alteromonas sp. D210916BOD_24]